MTISVDVVTIGDLANLLQNGVKIAKNIKKVGSKDYEIVKTLINNLKA
jgi:hypothetical protein